MCESQPAVPFSVGGLNFPDELALTQTYYTVAFYIAEFRADIFLELKAIAIHKIHTCILTYIHSFMHAFIYRDRHKDRHRDRPKDTTQNIAYQHIFLSLGLMDGIHVYSDV